MLPYTLTLSTPNKPDRPDRIFCSTDMIGYGLWSEFLKLPNITPQYFSSEDTTNEIPESDFTVIHCCFDRPIFGRLPEIRAKTKHKIMLVMEFEYNGPNGNLIDHSFTYIVRPNTEQIPLPCYKLFLNESYAPKVPKSILLDHQWSHTKEHEDMCHLLYGWFESHQIAQLRRPVCEAIPVPDWVHSINITDYRNYLLQTAQYETFIVTHRGSYEHSIIDMAARGTCVLVPTKDGHTFCHPSIVEDLNLSTFSTKEELFALLEKPPLPKPITKFTDMPDIAAKIDAYCQTVLVSSKPWENGHDCST